MIEAQVSRRDMLKFSALGAAALALPIERVARAKSAIVLSAALRDPAVAKLSVFAGQADAVAWLEQNVHVDFSISAETMQISMSGTRTDELKREVNDQDFDVGLHIVFDSLAAHDKYQDAADHLKFINENKDNWKKVRVFDSTVSR